MSRPRVHAAESKWRSPGDPGGRVALRPHVPEVRYGLFTQNGRLLTPF